MEKGRRGITGSREDEGGSSDYENDETSSFDDENENYRRKNDSSDSDDKVTKRKQRSKKRGRKAKFNIEQMMFDQQLSTQNAQFVQNYGYNQQQYYGQVVPKIQEYHETNYMNDVPKVNFTQTTCLSDANSRNRNDFGIPITLETVKPGYVPGSFDFVKRG